MQSQNQMPAISYDQSYDINQVPTKNFGAIAEN